MRCARGALILLFALSGCIGPLVPSAKPGRWHDLETAHFELFTDLPEPEAKDAARFLERERAAVMAAGWTDLDDRTFERVEVIVLRDRMQSEHLLGPHQAGLFANEVRPTIFMWGTPLTWGGEVAAGETSTSTFRHELVHRIERSIYPHEPRWFSEGLAQFLEVLTITDDGKRVVRGATNWAAVEAYQWGRSVRASDLSGWTTDAGIDEGTVNGYYGLSWALVHFLYNVHPNEFVDYQVMLAEDAEPAQAWQTCIAPLEKDLDIAIHHHLKTHAAETMEIPIGDYPSAVIPHPFGEADAHAAIAHIALIGARRTKDKERLDLARSEAAQALRLDPTNARALAVKARLDR